MWIELSDAPKFAYAEDLVALNTVFFLTGNHLHHLLGLFNSKLVTWYFRHCIGTTSGVGTNRWLKYTIEQIPLPIYNPGLEKLVKKRLENSTFEAEIEAKICSLYGLSDEEISFIREAIKNKQ